MGPWEQQGGRRKANEKMCYLDNFCGQLGWLLRPPEEGVGGFLAVSLPKGGGRIFHAAWRGSSKFTSLSEARLICHGPRHPAFLLDPLSSGVELYSETVHLPNDRGPSGHPPKAAFPRTSGQSTSSTKRFHY